MARMFECEDGIDEVRWNRLMDAPVRPMRVRHAPKARFAKWSAVAAKAAAASEQEKFLGWAGVLWS